MGPHTPDHQCSSRDGLHVWGGRNTLVCVCVVVGVNQKEKKENACTYDTPPQWEHLFIQDPQSVFITHLKKFTNVLPTTKPTKDNDSTKFLIKAGFLTHTHISTGHNKTIEKNLPDEWHHLLHYVLAKGDDNEKFLRNKKKEIKTLRTLLWNSGQLIKQNFFLKFSTLFIKSPKMCSIFKKHLFLKMHLF